MHRYYVSQLWRFARRFAKAIQRQNIISLERSRGGRRLTRLSPTIYTHTLPPEAAQRAYNTTILWQNGPRTHERSEARHGLYTKDFNVTIVCQQNTIYYPFLSAHGIYMFNVVDVAFVLIYTRRHLCRETCVPILLGYIVSKKKLNLGRKFLFFFLRKIFRKNF